MTTEDTQKTVLSGLCANDNEQAETNQRFSAALSTVRDEFFSGRLAAIWKILVRYFGLSSGVPSPTDFEAILNTAHNLPPSDRDEYLIAFKDIAGTYISAARFKLATVRLIEEWRDEHYQKVISDASQIHLNQLSIGDKLLTGIDDSINYVREGLSTIENLTEDHDEGDINIEGEDVVRDYEQAKGGTSKGVLSGFIELDAQTHGAQPGELWLIAGYTGEGKSKIAYNMAYSAAYIQRKNVLFGTAEATREQVRRNLVVRHTHHPKFDRPGGLRYSDVKWGTLSEADEQFLRMSLKDMRTGQYGRCYVFKIPHRASINYVADVLARQQRLYPADVIIVDYLGLMASDHRRPSRREELDDLLISSKRLAVDKNIPLISPWQLSRDAWKEAQKSHAYTKASLSDTSQAEKSTDLIMAILRSDENPSELMCQVLKYRDGEELNQFILSTDFATSHVTSKTESYDILE